MTYPFSIFLLTSLYLGIFAQIPSPMQVQFAMHPNTQFMHFSICTFIDCEWDTTIPNATVFNPTNIDTDQWMSTAILWGADTVCLTVRHVDGFALWPTKSSPYNIAAATNYQNGNGDIVRDFVNSANKFNINPCFYIILGFNIYANHTNVSGSQYLQDQQIALTELLTNYGPISRLWWDNYGLDASIYQPVTHEGFICENDRVGPSCPAWGILTNLVRSLQPQTMINPGPDGCIVDGENLNGQYPVYRNGDYGSYSCFFATSPSNGTMLLGVETDFSITSHWFYDNSTSIVDAGTLWSSITLKRGQGANIIMNVPPDTTGQVPNDVLNVLAQYRRIYDTTYANQAASLSAPVTGLCTNTSDGLSFTLPVDPSKTFDQLLISESLAPNGQVINGYTVEIQDNTLNTWTLLPVHGITIGSQVVDCLGNRTNIKNIRFNCTASIPGTENMNATIRTFGAYLGGKVL